jgi:hypothetical protein
MEAVRTSETSVDNHFTRQYNPEDSSEHHTRRRENLKSHVLSVIQFPFTTFVRISHIARSRYHFFYFLHGPNNTWLTVWRSPLCNFLQPPVT